MQNKVTSEYIAQLQTNISVEGALNILSLLANLRMVSRIENVSDMPSFENSLEYMGLCYQKVGNTTVYVSQHQAFLEKALEADGTRKNSHIFGRLLGYPECCIQAFIEAGGIGDDSYFEYLKTRVSQEGNHARSYPMNIFENKRIYHIPCSLDCPDSLCIGKKMEKLFLSVYPRLPEAYSVYPKKYLLFKNGEWVRFQEGSTSWGRLFGKGVTPIADTMAQGSILEIHSDHQLMITKDDQKQLLEYLEFQYTK